MAEQAIGAGFISDMPGLPIVDRVEHVISQEALESAGRLAQEEAILSEINWGQPPPQFTGWPGGKNSPAQLFAYPFRFWERYLSTPLFERTYD